MNTTLDLDISVTPGNFYENFTALVTTTLASGVHLRTTTARPRHVVTEFLERYYSIFILALGTIGNLLAFAVLSRKTFRVSTIGIFLRFLTLADLGALYTGVVYFLAKSLFDYDVRKANELSCKFHRWLSYVTCDLSSWALVLVSTARLISIVWPMKRLVTRKRVYIAIITTVVIIFGVNIPMFVMYSNVYIPATKQWKLCVFTSKSYEEFYAHIWGWIVFLKFTAVPGLILTGLNTALVLSVSRTGKALVKMDEFGGSKPVKAAANTKLMFSRWRRKGRPENDDQSSTRDLPDHMDTEVYETDLSESGFDNEVERDAACVYCGRAKSDKTNCLCLVIEQFGDPNPTQNSTVVSGWENNIETPLVDLTDLLKSRDNKYGPDKNPLILSTNKDSSADYNQNIQIFTTQPRGVSMSSNLHSRVDTSVQANPENNNLSVDFVDSTSLANITVVLQIDDNATKNYSQSSGHCSDQMEHFDSVKSTDLHTNSSKMLKEVGESGTTNDTAAITTTMPLSEINTDSTVLSSDCEDTTQKIVAENGHVPKSSECGNGTMTKTVVSPNTSTGSTDTHTTLLDEKDAATDAISVVSNNSENSAGLSPGKTSSCVQMATQDKIKKGGLRKSNNAPAASSSGSKSKSLTRSLLLINTVFLVTTIPISIYMSLKPYLFPGTEYTVEQEVYSTFSNFTMYTNNAINFILYCVTGSRFRQQLQLMFTEFYHACRRVIRKNA